MKKRICLLLILSRYTDISLLKKHLLFLLKNTEYINTKLFNSICQYANKLVEILFTVIKKSRMNKCLMT